MAIKKKVQLPISDRQIKDLAQSFKMLGDDSRLKVLLALSREGEMHVTALCDILGESQPAVSHHLTLLRMQGLVGFRRDGKFNFYYIDGAHFGDLLEDVFALAGKGNKIEFGDFSMTFARVGKRKS